MRDEYVEYTIVMYEERIGRLKSRVTYAAGSGLAGEDVVKELGKLALEVLTIEQSLKEMLRACEGTPLERRVRQLLNSLEMLKEAIVKYYVRYFALSRTGRFRRVR